MCVCIYIFFYYYYYFQHICVLQGLLSTPLGLRQPPVKRSPPQQRHRRRHSQFHSSLGYRPTTATTREAHSPTIFTNWWMTGQRRLSQQPVSPAPPWTRSDSRDANRTWKAGQHHGQDKLHMRYLNWRCSARCKPFGAILILSVIEQLLLLLSVSDEKPFWDKQLPVASLLSPDRCFKSSHGPKCSTVLFSNSPFWVHFFCRLL